MSTELLRRGDLVEVRGPAEILATLDEKGAFENVPFMPEMLGYCGRRFVVERRTEKICDTVQYNNGSLRLEGTVLLDDLRCDGSAHEGCQASCRLFFKEVWLRKVPADAPPTVPAERDAGAMALLSERVSRDLSTPVSFDGTMQPVWRCQATELHRCAKSLRTFDPRPYVRELTCGNVSMGHFISTTARAAITETSRKIGLVSGPALAGKLLKPPTSEPLNLQPGELVKVKTREEILETLDPRGFNRGLWFDAEMLLYCGKTFRVRKRITRFIDERHGRMVTMKTDAITLENVTCTGDYSVHRWFCPRAIYPYWRECWLSRLESPVTA